jgi:hypothetical protein
MDDVTFRAELESTGCESLQRLYLTAIDYQDDHASVVARFLLGLYNGARFPFDLTDLRLLGDASFEDCVAVLRMDARVTRREVHTYFNKGGRKFEQLVVDWNVVDVQRLKDTGDGSPTPPAKRGVLRHEDRVSARLVTYGEAPGYRDVTVSLDCEVVGNDRETVGPVRLEVNLGPDDGVAVMRHIRDVHARAWNSCMDRPLDARSGEEKPAWLPVDAPARG